LVYFLYTDEYINDEISWNRLISDLPGSRNPKWEGGDPLFHLAMLEVGQRHCLPELQFRAYQSFVLLFATQQKTQNEAHRWRHINIFCIIDDTDKETDEETEEETDEEIDEVSGDRVHAAIGTTLSDERLSELVSAVMADDSFSSITSILHLLVRVLLARKQWPRPPSSVPDQSRSEDFFRREKLPKTALSSLGYNMNISLRPILQREPDRTHPLLHRHCCRA
jgi:hypothetical protein